MKMEKLFIIDFKINSYGESELFKMLKHCIHSKNVNEANNILRCMYYMEMITEPCIYNGKELVKEF